MSQSSSHALAFALRMFLLLAAMLVTSSGLHAQNYSWDARSVGMGGATGVGQGNLAADFVPSDREYTAIVIPLGLTQVFSDLDVFNPNNVAFDPLRVLDYAGNPFHYSFNRPSSDSNLDFLKNLVDSGLSRDLNDYRGFSPPEHLVAGGVMAPNWGYTFKLYRGADESFQGIYVGAGPYITLNTDLRFDPQLLAIFESATPVVVPANTTFLMTNVASQRSAVALTGGYRAKLPFASSASERDGVYMSANFSYLIGLRQDSADVRLEIATDSSGLVTLTPGQVPMTVTDLSSGSGRGFTTDVGLVVVRNGWEVGVGANGLANRIDWRDHDYKQYTLSSLTTGLDFNTTTLPAPTGTVRTELPVEYLSHLGYSWGRWSTRTAWSYGVQKLAARAGAEYRLGVIDLRGGVRYALQSWTPTGGFGFNFTRRLGLDVGFFGNNVNLEQNRNISVAISLRIEKQTE
jgi:hypothetical protein